MMEHLQLYKEGKFEKRFKDHDPDEIGKLQQGINSVIDNVEMEIISRKTNEHMLSQEKSRAETSYMEKSESLANLHQLINNPLTSLLGFSKLITTEVNQSKQHEYLQQIQKSSSELQSLLKHSLIGQETASNHPSLNLDYESPQFQFMDRYEVVLAETDMQIASYIKTVLAQHEIEVFAYSNAEETINHIEEHETDLLILNMTAPDLLPEKTLKHVRSGLPKYLRDLPVIALVSDINKSDIEKYTLIGATEILSKQSCPT